MFRSALAFLSAGLILAAAPARASEAAGDPMLQALSLETAALDIDPGEYLWRDTGSLGPVTIIVSLPLQRLYAFRDYQLIGVAAVSTGKRGKRTPTGMFEILQKRQWHRSNLYSNAPMPFMQRLTWDGIALHGGQNPGYPASHGCIRLPLAFARLLFGATAVGSRVAVVADDVIAPPRPEERFVPQLVARPEMLLAPDFERVFARGRWAEAPRMVPRQALWVSDGLAAPDARIRVPTSYE
jgi:hypothetical protein